MKAKQALAITLVAVSLSAASGYGADRVISPRHASFLNDFRKVSRPPDAVALTGREKTFKSPRALQLERDFAKVARPAMDEPNLVQRPLYTGKNPFGNEPSSVQIAPVK